jgi:hypothetical protein
MMVIISCVKVIGMMKYLVERNKSKILERSVKRSEVGGFWII